MLTNNCASLGIGDSVVASTNNQLLGLSGSNELLRVSDDKTEGRGEEGKKSEGLEHREGDVRGGNM